MENNQMDSQLDISQFLNKFNQGTTPSSSDILSSEKPSISLSSVEENSRSFEKLEQKMEALEEKFAISSAQNDAVLKELAYTRQAVESQKTRDAFLSNLSTTIANLKASVEALSRNRPYTPVYNPPPPPRSFDTPATASYTTQTYYTQPATGQQNELRLAYQEKEAALAALHTARLEKEQVEASWNADRTAQESTIKQLRAEKDLAQAGWEAALSEKDKLAASWDKERAAQLIELDVAKTETTEKNRIIASLQQKASQLKAVNVALDREIKRVQQERTEALRKSAEQAKEILSLRDSLSAADERLKTFNFDGRIISIKRQYEQKVAHLESQLQEISAAYSKQVENIATFKTENTRLQQLVAQYEQQQAAQNEQTQTNFKEQLTIARQALQQVTDEKQALEANFRMLRVQIEENDSIIAGMREQIATLTQENDDLRSTLSTPSAPAEYQAPREPVLARRMVAKQPPLRRIHAKAAATIETPQPAQSAQNTPVELQDTLRAAIQTDADLPEIRVADPIPQEDLYNGEDFLERTDSFIGRMKWSIFREDK